LPPRIGAGQNAGVFPALRSRPLILLALLAWLAQLCLPAAHASVMAAQDTGLAAWCGERSPALAARIAALPDEVREILERGAAHDAGAHPDCLQFCAGMGGAAPPPAMHLAALHAARTPAPWDFAVATDASIGRRMPPARGPPATH
jgi:hypothetical protein